MARQLKLEGQPRAKLNSLIEVLQRPVADQRDEEDLAPLIVQRARNLLICGPGPDAHKEDWLHRIITGELSYAQAERTVRLLHRAFAQAGNKKPSEKQSAEDSETELRKKRRRTRRRNHQ